MIRFYIESALYSVMTVGSMAVGSAMDMIPDETAWRISGLFAFLVFLLGFLGLREGRRIMGLLDGLPHKSWYDEMSAKVDRIHEAVFGGPQNLGVHARLEKGNDRFTFMEGRVQRLEDNRWRSND